MTAVLLGRWPTGSPEWNTARAGTMTGSRIAAAAGISPHESPFSLWHRMAGEVGDQAVSPEMEWGTRLEAAVLAKFRDAHPEWRIRPTGTWQNSERPWQTGNPDGLITLRRGRIVRSLLECKTARYPDEWGEPGTDEIPVHYRAQVLWYLDTLGLDTCHVAVLIGGSDYREYLVTYDQAEAKILRRIGREFLASLARGERPPIDGHDSTRQVIRELHPDIESATVELSDACAHGLIVARADYDSANAVYVRARNHVADEMGDAHYAEWRGHRIADRRAKKADGSLPYVQIARTLPPLAALKEAS